ncbi:MAG: hypothetical protein LC802_00730 [Acidobacteria bacterium]|nr:hypothetical protein [Acidobacteriota bacterium]
MLLVLAVSAGAEVFTCRRLKTAESKRRVCFVVCKLYYSMRKCQKDYRARALTSFEREARGAVTSSP